MRKIILLLLLLNGLIIKAQDPLSSQFYFNPLYMNPAFAGINHSARIGATYRNQWTAIPSKFVTYNCWGDIYTPTLLNGGLGFMAMQDVAGEGYLKTTSFGIIQSYEFTLPNNIARMRTGYNVTVTNKRIDWSKLVFSDQLDALRGEVNPTSVTPGNSDGRTFADFDAGLLLDFRMIKRDKFIITQTAGYAGNHITRPNESLGGAESRRLPIKHTMHYTMTIQVLSDKKDKNPWYISPNIIYERQGITDDKGILFNKKAQFSTLNLGVYMIHRPLISGLFYRKRQVAKFKDSDSFIFFLGLHLETSKTSIIKIGYSYDFTINKLFSNTSGSHEVSLILEYKDLKLINSKARLRKKKKRGTDCPDFGKRTILF